MLDSLPIAIGGTAHPLAVSERRPRVLLVIGPHEAAFALHAAFNAQLGPATFLLTASAGDAVSPLGAPLHQPWDDASLFVLDARNCDPFGTEGVHPGLPRGFESLLTTLLPDIVDFHGVPWFGVDALGLVRRTVPTARVVLTLERIPAPCAPGPAWRPSSVGTTRAAVTPEAFLRDLLLRRFLAEVDCLVTRGPRLAEACTAARWPCRRIAVIPSGYDRPDKPLAAPATGRRLVVCCFTDTLDGEGVEVLAEAEAALRSRPATAPRIRVELHGALPAVLRAGIGAASSPLVHFPDLPGRDAVSALRNCHAVLVPGGSAADPPAIVGRALALGRPILCSDAGGTAALVRAGRDGLHFAARSGGALADLLDDLAASPERLGEMTPDGTGVPTERESVGMTADLYRRLLAADE